MFFLTTGVPAVPQHFMVKQITPHLITVKWDNVVDASSYKVEVIYPDHSRESILSFPNLLEVTLTGLTEGTSYSFKVRARSAFDYGPYSHLMEVSTLTIGRFSHGTYIFVCLMIKKGLLRNWSSAGHFLFLGL